MFIKLGCRVFEGGIFCGYFKRDVHHVKRIHSHPACAISLFEQSSSWQHHIPVENPDVIQAEKSAFKNSVSIGIFSICPPGKIDNEFLKNTF